MIFLFFFFFFWYHVFHELLLSWKAVLQFIFIVFIIYSAAFLFKIFQSHTSGEETNPSDLSSQISHCQWWPGNTVNKQISRWHFLSKSHSFSGLFVCFVWYLMQQQFMCNVWVAQAKYLKYNVIFFLSLESLYIIVLQLTYVKDTSIQYPPDKGCDNFSQ